MVIWLVAKFGSTAEFSSYTVMRTVPFSPIWLRMRSVMPMSWRSTVWNGLTVPVLVAPVLA